MKALTVLLLCLLEIIPFGKSFLNPVVQKDSVLVGDRLEYGVELNDFSATDGLLLPDFTPLQSDTMAITRGWVLDTLSRDKRGRILKDQPLKIQARIQLAFFEEGKYVLPPIPVGRVSDKSIDTLVFEPSELEVMQIPIDTNTFVIRDIKDQMTYPVTFAEVAPYVGFGLLGAALIAGLVWFIMTRRRKMAEAEQSDPPHIIALRKLDKFRGDKYWAADKQKLFYSGITDALKEYIDARFGVDAPEMTTDELFKAIKGCPDITPEIYSDLKNMFETADYVKFAKYHADDVQNAGALPLAVRFVTSTIKLEAQEAETEK